MRDYFDVEQYVKKLEQSENIQSCESVPIPDIEENQNYIFVSYSHKDYKKVYADLAYLYRAGVRFWYDRGLPAGKNWDAEVKERLESPRCSGVIFYLSENMFLSKSVNEEISLVCDTEQQVKKNYFCVNLTEGQPKDILKNIMRMDDEVLEYAGLDMDRIGVLARAFSDKQTYLQHSVIGYRIDLLEQIKEQFDVMDIRKHKRRFLKHLGTNAMIEITEDRYMIGKHIPNDCQGFCFSDHFVSAIHMCINTVGGESTVMDLGAANGTFVNDIRVDRKTEVPLKTGDIIRIGLQSFEYSESESLIEMNILSTKLPQTGPLLTQYLQRTVNLPIPEKK